MSSSTNGMILFVACILLTNSFKLRSPSIAKRIPHCCTNGYKEKAAVAKSVLIELQLPFKENEEILRIKNDIILTKAIDGKVILIVTNTVAHFFRIREIYQFLFQDSQFFQTRAVLLYFSIHFRTVFEILE
jgi:hypothetical protein